VSLSDVAFAEHANADSADFRPRSAALGWSISVNPRGGGSVKRSSGEAPAAAS
jgi:hypothetical protein